MDSNEFRIALIERISKSEWELLERDDSTLVISSHNRNSLLEMRTQTPALAADVDLASAQELEHSLRVYLQEHMADAPQGHKWIVLACLYLAFVARKPMHPIDLVGITVQHGADGVTYYCPLKKPADNLICDVCVCSTSAADAHVADSSQ